MRSRTILKVAKEAVPAHPEDAAEHMREIAKEAVQALPNDAEVKASQSINGSEEVEDITGYLLAHSEGRWYVFDEEYTILRTLRDDKALVDVLYP